uniref:Imidazolonepropionase and related amidohydrolases n=1 Tax=uncultured gamma proteobacterium HF0010_05D02 TaxID=710978 RepID=E0XQM0_9GAMM|nr:imidazolonepropionase and related amidohydrolases [uncultured gamma proteobacterium HF0010_05D02]
MTRFTRLFSSFGSQLCRLQFSQLTALIRLPRLATLSLCLAFAPFQVAAQNMVIKGATILDVTNGDLIKNHVVIVRDGRIDAVSAARSADIPKGIEVIDLQGHTLLPGLIDMHVHLTSGGGYHGYERLKLTDERRAILGVVHAKQTLMAGFTTVRNVGAGSFGDVALRDAINDGDIPGPRMLVSGPPIGITGGHCSDNNLLPPEYGISGEGVADGPWAARTAVRRNIKFGADLIKTCSTGGVLSKGTKVGAPQYTVEELTALIDEAHSRGLKVASHAHGAEGIINALIAGADTIEHASFIDDQGIRLAIENDAALSMDIYVTEYILGEGASAGILEESLEKERMTGAIQRSNFRKAVEAGATIVYGTDAGVYPHGQNAKQLSRMTRFGMTPLQALQSATTVAAEVMGLGYEVGKIEVGYAGDFVAVEGNPIEQIELLEAPSAVIKGGVRYR